MEAIDTGGREQQMHGTQRFRTQRMKGKSIQGGPSEGHVAALFFFISDSFSPASAFAWKYTCLANNIQHPPGEVKKKKKTSDPRVLE